MKEKTLSVVIITRNEANNIGACLQSLQWADEVILVDSGSTDQTREIAQKAGAKIISLPFKGLAFAQWRNEGLKAAQGKWLLYVDADERVSPELRKEIEILIKGQPKFTAYQIPRRNFYLGKEVHYGGAWPNYVKRLFLKEKLKRWERRLHEDPVFEGELGTLKSPLIHRAHQSLTAMMANTSQWSKIEAELLFEAHHPPVTWWRILRIMLTEFWERGIKLQAWRDGTVGWIELIFQMFSRFATYAQLWELQQKKSK